MYWNPILDETGKSQWGWKQNSLVSVDSETGEATFNPEYHIFKHLTHFVKPGARKIQTAGYNDAMAFENPDGKTVVVISNAADKEKSISIKAGDKEIYPVLAAHSFHTFEF
jgi:glucosylceramidase